MENTTSERHLLTMLCNYWYEHPMASDTAAGIRDWWLPAGLAVMPDRLAACLARLAGMGLVEALPARGGAMRFRLRPGADMAALRRLAEGG